MSGRVTSSGRYTTVRLDGVGEVIFHIDIEAIDDLL